MRRVTLLVATLVALLPAGARAQEDVRRYEPGMARGFTYGGYLHSPIHALPIERAGSRESLGPGAGAGLEVRLGYELPAGFTIELYGGFAFSEIAAVPMEDPLRSHVLTQGEIGLGLRYAIFTGTPVVPFARIGAGSRFLFFTWGSDGAAAQVATVALDALLGVHFALAPFFGIEAGAIVEYAFGLDYFAAGLLPVSPFVGVTLYLFDESDALTAP